ncbi:alpha/beta fold hydrolase [Nocardioides plantarum]|uniref:Alpha/beta fold hydrolase n=1 Tax=Nocardioides plantarum TaxID=29299 RepID=A0ABV5KG34_9ACTN|nr:alpha/beta hydrolase [Nocardioides plantarum]
METISLPDGRLLDLDPGPGDPALPTVVAHHGTPGAGTRDRHLDAVAAAAGVRVVTFSRAGYGGSTRHRGRTVADVAADVEALLDHLGVATCATMGASGGGPHALATAALLPDRVTGVLCIAGVGPWGEPDLDFMTGMGEDNVEEFGLALAGEDDVRPWLEEQAAAMRGTTPAQLVESMASILPEVDRAAVLGARGVQLGEDLVASFAEALRPGVDGWLDDDLAFTRPWGFDLDGLVSRKVPTFVWQGEVDLMVPPSHGRWLAARLTHASSHLLPDEGHLSISLGHLEQMIADLAATIRP